jgi:hypothetical protein
MTKHKFDFTCLEDAGGLDIQALQLLAQEIAEDEADGQPRDPDDPEEGGYCSWINWAGQPDHKVPTGRLSTRNRHDLLLLDQEFCLIDERLRLASRPRWDQAADHEHIAMLQALIEKELVQPHWGFWTRSPPDVLRRR